MTIRPAVIIMVRDEADIIRECLNWWVVMGVFKFYICDNSSVDGTRTIIERWKASQAPGISVETSVEIATDWPGRRVLNSLKDKAVSDGCNLLFPADADEFLILPECLNVTDWFASLNATSGWGEIPYLNILPDGRMNWQEPQRKAFGVITRDMTISMGNHLIEEQSPTIKAHGAYYRHHSLRSYPQYKKKMENYMVAFSQTQFQDHPHAVSFRAWQIEGEGFLKRKWMEITGLKPE